MKVKRVADVASDHHLLEANLKKKIKDKRHKTIKRKIYDGGKLKDLLIKKRPS